MMIFPFFLFCHFIPCLYPSPLFFLSSPFPFSTSFSVLFTSCFSVLFPLVSSSHNHFNLFPFFLLLSYLSPFPLISSSQFNPPFFFYFSTSFSPIIPPPPPLQILEPFPCCAHKMICFCLRGACVHCGLCGCLL
jgi:hypothetical protein